MNSIAQLLSSALLGICLSLVAFPSRAEAPQQRHAIAMHGEPALSPGFTHLPYANPDAPQGGKIVLALQGTYDSLNPLIVLGVAPDLAPRYVLQSLMVRSQDEPFTLYGLLARTVEMPDDRSSIAFNLDPRARFSDGKPVTSEDIRFTFEMLKANGKPIHRASFARVKTVSVEGNSRIHFDLTGSGDRELPLIIATMPIFAAHATDPKSFSNTSLKPMIGSGPYAFDEIRPGERVSVKRRADYWGKDLPVMRGLFNFDSIQYDFYRDANSLFEAFKAGLYDFRIEGDPGRWATGYDFPMLRNGRIVKESLATQLPKGMSGFVFNTRKTIFQDVRVREALGGLFDQEWVNRNLYFGLLERCNSYFSNSDLSAYGRAPTRKERELLEPYKSTLSPAILEGTWRLDSGDGSGRDRAAAQKALALLAEAGWTLKNGVLQKNETREPLSFELLVNSRQQERLALNFAESLKRIGVDARVRLVDEVQYWRRLSRFDYDMIQWTWLSTPSPGTEQRNRWSSAAANSPGSLNFAGASSPAIDAMLDALLAAESREDFIAAVRALDRTLLAGFYVVPLFYAPKQWIAYSRGLQGPEKATLFGPNTDTWWRR
jgi:peptide/nickel transport system substrate-binding protein